MKYDLSGTWTLKLDADKNCSLSELNFTDSIEFPGTVSQQKKSKETSERATGFLTDPFKYEGNIFVQKTIKLEKPLEEEKKFSLFLERTRYTTLWINKELIGSQNTIIGNHVYNFSLPENTTFIEITLLISNINYIVPGGHMTSADTQTNWIGIIGEMYLEELIPGRISDVKTYTDVNTDAVNLKIKLDLEDSKSEEYTFEIPDVFCKTENVHAGSNEFNFSMPENIQLWSAQNPFLYELKISSKKYTKTVKIGFRSFKAKGKYLENNGIKVFLRGKHDGMIFPETGFAPADKESWLKVLKTAKDYGINHYRFHTCCPPKAAFEAADETGIYMSPELPFWGTIQAPGEEGFNKEQQDYLISEGYRILDTFGNHPSFVMMSMGNELWGSEKRIDEIMELYHNYDDRHLYTGGSNNFQFWPRTTEHEDYFVGVRFSKEALIRGSYAMCDAPLGFIQTDEPNSSHDYDRFFENPETSETATSSEKEIEIQYGTGVKKVRTSNIPSHFIPNKPCISHEVGQYCMYPDFDEIKRYTGVLKPYNFEEFKNRLEKAGLLSKAKDYFRDSSRLAVQCYKNEIEAALRSNELSGFQLLDIQDFTGQGTAVVGILNSFMESKGIVESYQWRTFCNDTVLLASFDRIVFEENEVLRAAIILHNYSFKSFKGNYVTAYLIDSQTSEILCEESFDINDDVKGNQNLGVFTYKFENVSDYTKYTLFLILQEDENSDDAYGNSYFIHVYPEKDKELISRLNLLKTNDSFETDNVLVTKNPVEAAKEKNNYKKIILIPEKIDSTIPGLEKLRNPVETVQGTYCTDFWCYPMFRSISESMKKPVPTGTLGLTINTASPLLKEFPTDSYTTPKWFNIVNHSSCINLLGTDIEPDIQMIDNFERNWKLGILYRTGNITVCTSRLWEISEKPEVCQFLKSLIKN